jgi:hypothetical protein
MPDFVYFAEDIFRRVIKVGYTSSPHKRILTMQAEARTSGGYLGMRFSRLVRGDRDLESDLLRRFSAFRVRGKEWFRYSPEILEVASGFDAIPAESVPGLCPHGSRPSYCAQCDGFRWIVIPRLRKSSDREICNPPHGRRCIHRESSAGKADLFLACNGIFMHYSCMIAHREKL